MKPDNIGRYEILEVIGRGGMGVVYKARDPLIDRVVAIKTLGSGLSRLEAEDFRRRFAHEAKSAGNLAHPNIVTIHDMGESDDGAYIAMEFIEGRSLRDVLDSGTLMRPEEAARIAVEVASGLAFAHAHGVVHCDVKPGNIMLVDSGAVKITDFGVARLPTGSRTFVGNVLGSPRYISPEQIVSRPVDARSDLFSLGALLYEMLTGATPFPGTAIDEILFQVINDKPVPPSRRNPAIPAAFDGIVARAMAKHPDDRYPNAEALASALRPLLTPGSPSKVELPPIGRGQAVTIEAADGSPFGARPPREERPAVAPRAASAARVRRQLREVAANPAFAEPAAEHAPPPRRRWRVVGLAGTAAAAMIGAVALAPRAPEIAPGIVHTKPSDVWISSAHPAVDTPVSDLPAARPDPSTADVPPVAARATEPVSAAKLAHAAPAPGRLQLAVAPWGEIHVDGKRLGVTPPLTEVKLAAGRHVVEIRNSTFAPHRETVEMPAGGTLRIRHRFE